MKPEKTSGFRVLNVGFRVLFGYQFSGSGSKKVGFFPRVSGFRVPEPITTPLTRIVALFEKKIWGAFWRFSARKRAVSD